MGKDFNFSEIVQNVATKFGKHELASVPPQMVVAFPSFILRLLFQSEGIVLGKIVHIVGLEATFKSTLALEITKWHIAQGGVGATLHTEARVNEQVIQGVLGDYKDAHTTLTCDTLEEWQAMLVDLSNRLGEDQKKLACFTIDSLMGVSSAKTISEVMKDGFATTTYAREANLIASYLRVFNSKLNQRPHTVCIINHRKFRPNAYNYGPPEKTALGGNEPKFYMSYDIETSSAANSKQVLGPITTYEVALKLDKNTFGQEGVQVKVPIRFVNTPNDTRVAFDWYAATAQFLNKFNNVKPIPTPTTVKRVNEVLSISTRRGGPKGELYYSDALGIPATSAVSATELGIALEENQQVLEELYRIFGIARKYVYNSELTYTQNIEEADKFYSKLKQESTTEIPEPQEESEAE